MTITGTNIAWDWQLLTLGWVSDTENWNIGSSYDTITAADAWSTGSLASGVYWSYDWGLLL